MQNVGQESSNQVQKFDKMSGHDTGKSSTPQSSNSSPTKSDTDPYSEINPRYLSDSSESEDEDVSLVESFVIDQVADLDETEARLQSSKFLLAQEDADSSVDPETQARLEALLEAAVFQCVSSQAVDNPMSRSAIDHIKEAFYIGIGKLATGDGKQLADPEVLRRLTSSVSCALDEAAAALTRMRNENPRPLPERQETQISLVEACSDGDVGTVRKLLTEGRSVHETTDEGESLLSLACSAGYYELAQVLLAMHANVEDRGIKGDCTPLMEAASSGYVDIVRLLIHHGADVNAQSSSGNTPLMYACAGGHVEAVRVLLDAGANVEDHNENGHTPLMEAASAGHVPVAEILLARGAGINTHSNEFKESALTLACYKGHLDMVRFLLEAGADQEHKTDEMHTALMEASMDGHVEVARLLLDSGAQVNMPTDSFESPLTLAACGGHVDLALLLIERGANIEEVNDEGYTPLMEAAREGHEDMVAVLLVKGANINAQTEETQETALTLACCGGFLEVANFLIKNGAEIELGASTPLMEAAQEGHLDLVRYLLEANADVNAQTQTGDTALTYACENGHTEVAKLLLQHGADLEHESEGGRTPLMKACRAGHLCTVKFLLSQNANVNKQTTNNDHTPLSLAAAGGHIAVVELLLAHSANPFHKLKDNSTMLIEAAKGGHTNVVQLLLDYPHSIMMRGGDHSGGPIGQLQGATPSTSISPPAAAVATVGLHDVPEAVRAHLPPEDTKSQAALGRISDPNQGAIGSGVPSSLDARSVKHPSTPAITVTAQNQQPGTGASLASANTINSLSVQKSLLRKSRLSAVDINSLTSPEAQQVRNQPPLLPISNELSCTADDPSKGIALVAKPPTSLSLETQFFQRQQIVEELQRVEQELKERGARAGVLLDSGALSPTGTSLNSLITPTTPPGPPPDPSTQGMVCGSTGVFHSGATPSTGTLLSVLGPQPAAQIDASPAAAVHQPITPSDVVQATAISDRPKAKPTWKKEGKNNRKQSQAFQAAIHQQQQYIDQSAIHYLKNLVHKSDEGTRNQAPTIATSEATTNGSSNVVPSGGLPPTNGSPPNKSFVKLSPMIRHSEVVTQLRAQQECNELMQRRSPLLPQVDEDALIDLPKAGKREHENLGIFTPEQVEELAKMSPADRERMRLSFMAGVEAAAKLRASRPPLPIVFEPMGLQSAAGAPNWHHVTPDIVDKGVVGAAIGRSLVDPLPCALSQQPQQQVLPPPTVAPTATSAVVNATAQQFHQTGPTASFLKAPPPWAKDLVPTTPAPASAGAREQVQAGTQTSPAPDATNSAVAVQQPQPQQQPQQPPPAMSKKSGGQALNSSGTGTTPGTKGRRTRFHLQQKSTQAPPIHPDSNHTGYPCEGQTSTPGVATFGIDVDSATDSNNDTALTLACAGGHEELCELLLSRGANIEHRDKKGFTPLILAATAGHDKVVEILMNHQADMEAQSERTKDTPLSLACSGGRYEVVELLLSKGANKEHRNVSDYTPLSLAASGGYVNIIKLLLAHGAEINSRTGSKLGISPLMLAAMNGHTTAVKLLLDMGSDINAQIETNRNTALTLACFQGRNEVVSLLLDRRANVEHRAKTGLTPLMEAASGGYVEVGRVLLDKGADVNAPPVPSSRDTALTIAADKGHCRFVELLLNRNAQVEVKNKKGNSPLWLAANGGHLPVVELLYSANADIDSQDNRKVSCLMAAFRKGHVKVVKWMVNHVTQFPSDQEMTRYISTVNDKELLEKCQECTIIIRAAKDQQAAKANKNATILLEELYMEKTREESKKAAAARKRERKKKKKLEKKEEKRKLQEENQKNERYAAAEEDDEDEVEEEEEKSEINKRGGDLPSSSDSPARGGGNGGGGHVHGEVEEGDSGIDANSQGSCSSNEVKGASRRKEKKKKKPSNNGLNNQSISSNSSSTIQMINNNNVVLLPSTSKHDEKRQSNGGNSSVASSGPSLIALKKDLSKNDKNNEKTRNQNSNKILSSSNNNSSSATNVINNNKTQQPLIFEPTRHPADREDFEATGNDNFIPAKGKKSSYLNYSSDDILPSGNKGGNATSPKQAGKRDEGWKEVVRKYLNSPFKSKKVSVPLHAISRVIGRGGSNINAIRTATGAHIEVEKQSKGQGERIITLKGSLEATKQAHSLIAALVKDPEVDILQILPKSANKSAAAVWEKSVNTAKSKPGKGSQANQNSTATSKTTATSAKRLAAVTATKTTMSYTNAIMTSSRVLSTTGLTVAPGSKPLVSPSSTPGQTFAAKLSSADVVQSLASIVLPPVTTVVVMSSSPMIATAVAPPLGSIVTNVAPSITSTSSSASALTTIVPTSVMSTTTSPPLPRLPTPPAQAVSPPSSNKLIRPPPSPTPIVAVTVPVIAPTPVPATVITVNNSAPRINTASPPPPPSSLPGVVSPSPSTTGVTQSTSPSTSTTLEYSLFNDNFTKVTQQSVWGREADNQRREGMNFASAAAAGAPNASAIIMPPTSNKYLDPSPPTVDASKAPGYRGNSVCSPVSKGSSSAPPSTSTASSSVVGSVPYFPSQPETSMTNSYRPPPPAPVYQSAPPPTQADLDHSSYHPTSVTMSRLNPRAPDFSTTFKPQLYQQGGGNGGAPYLPPTILPNNNVISFPPMGKFPGATRGANGPARWSMMAPSHYATQSDVTTHLATLATISQTADLLGSTLENVTSPNVSPSSPQQQPPSDDRKVPPRPIGTERAWKNYTSMAAANAEIDMAPASWMIEPKMNWQGTAGLGAGPTGAAGAALDNRHAGYFRPGPTPTAVPPPVAPPFSRIALQAPEDIPHMLDTTYQGGLDSSQFSGAGAGISMMHHTPLVMPQHYAGVAAAAVAAAAAAQDLNGPGAPGTEWDQPTRPLPDLHQDKTHYYCSSQGWTTKWSH